MHFSRPDPECQALALASFKIHLNSLAVDSTATSESRFQCAFEICLLPASAPIFSQLSYSVHLLFVPYTFHLLIHSAVVTHTSHQPSRLALRLKVLRLRDSTRQVDSLDATSGSLFIFARIQRQMTSQSTTVVVNQIRRPWKIGLLARAEIESRGILIAR
jgi:hypothetical protein